jgi:hypothetical protein
LLFRVHRPIDNTAVYILSDRLSTIQPAFRPLSNQTGRTRSESKCVYFTWTVYTL